MVEMSQEGLENIAIIVQEIEEEIEQFRGCKDGVLSTCTMLPLLPLTLRLCSTLPSIASVLGNT